MRQAGLDPGEIGAVFVSHLHGDHFGGLPFLILDGQSPAGPPRSLSSARQGHRSGSQRRWSACSPARRRSAAGSGHRDGAATRRHPNRGRRDGPGLGSEPPSGAPALILRLAVGATVIAYTGDTAWTPAITEASRDADLLVAEAYHWDKAVPHHLRYTDLTEHEITARRVILTHMSADMFSRPTLFKPPATAWPSPSEHYFSEARRTALPGSAAASSRASCLNSANLRGLRPVRHTSYR